MYTSIAHSAHGARTKRIAHVLQLIYMIRAMPAISVTVLDGGCSIVNSRILRVQESPLLKDILCMVTVVYVYSLVRMRELGVERFYY